MASPRFSVLIIRRRIGGPGIPRIAGVGAEEGWMLNANPPRTNPSSARRQTVPWNTGRSVLPGKYFSWNWSSCPPDFRSLMA